MTKEIGRGIVRRDQTRYAYQNPTDPSNSNGTYTLTSNPYRAATSSAASGESTMGWVLGYINKTGKHSENSNFSGTSLPAPWGNNTNTTGMVSTDTDTDRILVTDQAGKQRISKTNVLGQLSDVWEIAPPDSAPNSATEQVTFTGQNNIDAGYRTIYTYNVLGSLTRVVQGSQIRSFTYNSLSLLTSAANPESGTTNYQYDANGNLISKIDARGVIVSYAYDALNRVKQRSYSGESGESGGYSTPMVTYEYDTLPHAKGKLTEINSSISATRYTSFSVKGAVLSSEQTTGGGSFVQNYSYNLSGALVEQTYPDGRRVKSVLKNDGSLSSIESKKNSSAGYWTYASNFSYTPARNLSGLQFGNGHWESADFNSRLQPTRIALGTTQNGTNLLKLDYSYGTTENNGNALSQAIEVQSTGGEPGFTATQVYAYDSLNRLKDAEETIDGSPSWRQSFVYDRYGNRNFNEELTTTLLKKCGDGRTEAVCESDRKVINPSADPANNRLAAGQDYVFDAAGNTTADAEGHTFLLDGENKIVQIIENNVVVGKYYYDGDGKRVKKETVGEITVFVYDINRRTIAEYSTATSETPQVAYLTSDALGSPRINTSAGGAVISRHDYHPFGEEISTPQRTLAIGYDSDEVRKKFTGYERDEESGLDFAQARMYSSQLGRFNTCDPIYLSKEHVANPQRWNLYVFVINNPINLTDPDGQKPRVIDVFLTYETSKEGRAGWRQLKKDAAKLGVKINIYRSENGTATAGKFINSVKTADRIVVIVGHSYSDDENAPKHKGIGLMFYNYSTNATTSISTRENVEVGKATNTLDGVTAKAKLIAVFVCDFGKAFDKLKPSNNVDLIYSKGGRDGESGLDSGSAAAVGLTRALVNGGTAQQSRAAAQEGFNAFRREEDDDDTIERRVLRPRNH